MIFNKILQWAGAQKAESQEKRTVLIPRFKPVTKRAKRAPGTHKYHQLTSGVPIRMRTVKRPWSGKMIVDTRPRQDGHPNCHECGHNRFKTKGRFGNGQRLVACRGCGSEALV